jgi:hypothetical protein
MGGSISPGFRPIYYAFPKMPLPMHLHALFSAHEMKTSRLPVR